MIVGNWGMRERYERYLRQRADGELEEARDKLCTYISERTNKTKSCQLDANRDAKEILREQ